MLNRLLQPNREQRQAYVDAMGHIARITRDSYAGIEVDTETTLSVPAIWRAVTMIADSVGGLPLHAYRNDQKLEPTPRLLERPYPMETRVETISAMTAALIIHGNYVAILGEPGSDGYPQSIYPVNPDRCVIRMETFTNAATGIKTREVIYRIDDTPYRRDQIFHIKGFSLPGDISGIGIIAAQRQGIGAAVAVMKYAARYFDGGAMPSYAIKSENPDLNEVEADLLKQKWMMTYDGTNREPVVLNASTSLQPLNANASDSQLVEARNMAVSDASNIVGLPGTYLNAPNTSRTYTNTEAQGLEYLRTTIAPLTVRIESAFTDYLPRGQEAKFSYDSLLRADTLSRYQAHKLAIDSGFLTVDEVREIEDLPPIGTPIEQPSTGGIA